MLLSGKICLITGANAGIGYVTALRIAEMGARVILVCRDKTKGEAAREEIRRQSGNPQVELLLGDLSSQHQLHRLADEFKEQHDRLDVLINNAGLYMPKRTMTAEGFEMTFAVNHLAYFLLTDLLLDILKASAPARIINVASAAHFYGKIEFDNLQGERKYGGVAAYNNSKLANVLFTRELARRLAGTGVTANSLHPGAVATQIFRRLPKPLEWIIKALTKSPEEGAQTTIYLASSPEVEGVSGKYFDNKQQKHPSRLAQDDELARQLWEASEQLVRSP